MNDLNSVLVEGNMVRDAELKQTASGTSVCTFSIASNRSYKKGDGWEKESSFFDCEAWGKLAENIADRAKKGRGVRVVGRLKQERWEDVDSKQRSRIKIVCEHVEIKPERKSASDGGSEPAKGEPTVSEEIPF